ncbi:YdbL family protein [Methylomarinum sp. Ch1-1]|uniref:YdbL family protein n=1 Tax=Methylomarinum roseum TaxID=3067653 RepID=A0AAU7NPX6_9GAMM|nr:YdbL family protein [Methylomarinum sp. Ch1-1]MDP4521053.1 YdbL family protein [Methylomarinum sp. Ch1-1]
MKQMTFIGALFLTACVTINIYFPAAAAEKVADEIIQDIQQAPGADAAQSVEPQSRLPGWRISFYRRVDELLDVLITPAHAAANLSVDSAEIRRIRASMQSRFADLKPFYDAGYIAIGADGMLTVRGSVPLRERNRVNKLVAAENADRNKLYQAIANANGHPEWFAQIKETFAARWISNAHSGWWYQTSNGSYKQK